MCLRAAKGKDPLSHSLNAPFTDAKIASPEKREREMNDRDAHDISSQLDSTSFIYKSYRPKACFNTKNYELFK